MDSSGDPSVAQVRVHNCFWETSLRHSQSYAQLISQELHNKVNLTPKLITYNIIKHMICVHRIFTQDQKKKSLSACPRSLMCQSSWEKTRVVNTFKQLLPLVIESQLIQKHLTGVACSVEGRSLTEILRCLERLAFR